MFDTQQWIDRTRQTLAEKHQVSKSDVCVHPAHAKFKSVDQSDKYRFEAVISDATADSDNEVLLPDGVNTKRFDRTGSGFYMHDYNRPPIFVPRKVRMIDGQLVGSGRFLTNELAEDVREFVEVMNAEGKSAGVSVGAIYRETRKPTAKDKARFGESVETVVSKWELLEWSIAPIQANPAAMVTHIGTRATKSLFGWTPESEPKPMEPTAPTPIKRVTVGHEIAKARQAMKRAIRDKANRKRRARGASRAKREQQEAKALSLATRIAKARQRGELYV